MMENEYFNNIVWFIQMKFRNHNCGHESIFLSINHAYQNAYDSGSDKSVINPCYFCNWCHHVSS